MKTSFVTIVLFFAVTAAHSMPVSVLKAGERSATIPISDQCGDRCGSFYQGYRRHAFRGGYSGRYVLVRDPLIQRRPFCPLGTYVACIGSGTFCIDLCY